MAEAARTLEPSESPADKGRIVARIILIAIALMATLAETGSGVAAGAIAVGRPDDIAKRGISMGFSTNRETMDEAKTRSLKLCANSGSLISGVLCEVVATFENKCVAVAIDPAEQTPGFGWAVADTEQASKDNALSNCRATAGPTRRNACEITDSSCDGSAKSKSN
jgi:hypothetical protein